MLLIIAVVLGAIISNIPFATYTVGNNIQEKVENNIMNIAKVIAKSYLIRKELENKDPNQKITLFVDDVYKNINEIEFIVIADMDGTRYSHPNKELIGRQFVGGDENRVLEKGESYVSEGIGTLGESLRSFVPIYDLQNKNQIGFVSVGTLKKSIKQAKLDAQFNIGFLILIGMITGSIGAVLLAESIKKTLLGLEPEEISKLYNEKNSMLKAIHEGIISIDIDSNINMINDSALEILQLKGKYSGDDLIGKSIKQVFPNSTLPRVLISGTAEYNDEQVINNTVIVTNRVPIRKKDVIIGALATFRDKTEVTNLAEEVTGVKQIVEALRANTHEFMNKLHVILGLIQLNEIKEAEKFILQTAKNQELILTNIIKKIKDPTIAGLILGKTSRAKELGINFKIDENCNLNHAMERKITNHTLITIIGNLIENAFEAVNKSTSSIKEVFIKIVESDQKIEIIVKDTGVGIQQQDLKKIFNRGYSTKDNSKGVGLDLVQKIVNILEGEINVTSKVDKGTTFNIIIPKRNNEVNL